MTIARWIWQAAFLIVLCGSPAIAAESASATLHHILPAGGFAAIEVVDLAAVLDSVQKCDGYQEWLKSPVLQGWSIQPEGRNFFAVKKFIDENFDFDIWTLAKSLVGRRCALALYPPVGEQPVDYVLLLEVADAEFLASLRQKLRPWVSNPGEKVTMSDRLDGGWQLRHEDGHITVLIDRWVVTSNNLSLLEMTIGRRATQDGESLADEPARRKCLEQLGADHLAFGWINPAWVKQEHRLERLTPAQREQPLNSLLSAGIAELVEQTDAVGFALNIREHDLRLTTTIAADAAGLPESLVGLFPQSVARNFAVPDQLARIDIDRDLTKWYDARKTLLTPKAVEACERFETMFRAFVQGTDFEKDLLPTLGTHWTLLAAPQSFAHLSNRPTPELPAFALVGELKDAERGAKFLRLVFDTGITLANLQAAQQKISLLKVETETYRDQVFILGSRAESKESPRTVADNVSPAFAVVGDRFFIATSPDLGRTLIDALLSADDSQRPATHLGWELDPAVAADVIYANRTPLLAQMVKDGKWHWQGERELDWFRAAAQHIEPIRFETQVKPDHLLFDLSARWGAFSK